MSEQVKRFRQCWQKKMKLSDFRGKSEVFDLSPQQFHQNFLQSDLTCKRLIRSRRSSWGRPSSCSFESIDDRTEYKVEFMDL